MVKRVDIAWLAGIADGEGTITVHNRKFQTKKKLYNKIGFVFKVTNNNTDLLNKVIDVCFGITGKKANIEPARGGFATSKPLSRIRYQTIVPVIQLTKAMLPYLTAKKVQAKLVLELHTFLKTNPSWEAVTPFIEKIRIANHAERFLKNMSHAKGYPVC